MNRVLWVVAATVAIVSAVYGENSPANATACREAAGKAYAALFGPARPVRAEVDQRIACPNCNGKGTVLDGPVLIYCPECAGVGKRRPGLGLPSDYRKADPRRALVFRKGR